jgi:hypothetical protein
MTSKNDFGADEVIKKETKNNNTQQTTTFSTPEPVNLSEEKYMKLFELNDEGLRLYGKYKKEQMWTILKWSCLGTAVGYSFSIMFDIIFKNMQNPKKDIIQSSIFIVTMGFFTYTGLQASTYRFKLRQNELVQNYGKEINNI